MRVGIGIGMYVRCMFVLPVVRVLEVGISMEEGWLGPGGRTGNNVGFTGDHGGGTTDTSTGTILDWTGSDRRHWTGQGRAGQDQRQADTECRDR